MYGRVEYHDFMGGAVGEPGEFMDCNTSTANLLSQIPSKAPQSFTEAHGYEYGTEMPDEKIERLEGILDGLMDLMYTVVENSRWLTDDRYHKARFLLAQKTLGMMGERRGYEHTD